MEKRTNCFLFYASYIESLEELPKELKYEIAYSLDFYGIYGKLPEDITPIAKAMILQVKNLIDKSILRQKQGSEAGKAPKPNNGKKKEFAPPSFDEVRDYVLSQNYDEDVAKSFYGHLESIGFECNGYKKYFENWI